MTTLDYVAVRKSFGSVTALHHFDLSVREGELVTLLGPSGCGKTTALRIAAGFEFSDAGTVLVGNADITRTPAHQRNMGMVFQSYSLFPNLTVADNIDFGLRTRRQPSQQRHRRVAEMLELVQLTANADRYPHQLSGGQQQRVALARALAVQPRVLLLDEPLSALDAKVRSTLRDEIRRIQTEVGTTTIFVTHDQEEALAISDRVCVMSNGQVEQLGTPTEVYRTPATPFVARFVGAMNALDGEVAAPGELSVLGYRFAAPSASGQPVGAAVKVLVRPEDLRLAADGLAGTVAGVTFQGATTLLRVRIDTLDDPVGIAVGQGGADALSIGDRVHIEIIGTNAMCETR